MRTITHEFLVGLLAIVAVAFAVWAVAFTDDRPDGVRGTWTLTATFAGAEGVYPDTPVRIAGVPVGSVDAVQLDGGRARVTMMMQSAVTLPIDSVAEIKGEGMLGDKFVRIVPGSSATLLGDGGEIRVGEVGTDLDQLTAKMSLIADDVKAITGSIRQMTGDESTQAQLRATLANIEALSVQLRVLAETNQADLGQITANLREVSQTLKTAVSSTTQGVEAELEAVRVATESLDRTLGNLEEISARVNAGEGTIGRLLSDEETIDGVNLAIAQVNDTVAEANKMVKQVSRIETEVYYRGDVYYGSDPAGGEFTNPVSGGMRNVVGARLIPRPDYWYVFEFVSHPVGSIEYTDYEYPDLGTSYRKYTVRPDYRFTFQFAKRWKDLVFRFGLKESSGAIGFDGYLFNDRAQLSADLYDFTYGSWPVMDGTPQLQLTARAFPFRHVYVEGGLDNVILGARYGYVTGFAGGGFSFTDNDLKFVLAALPFSP